MRLAWTPPGLDVGQEHFCNCRVFPLPFPKGDPEWPQLNAPPNTAASWGLFFRYPSKKPFNPA